MQFDITLVKQNPIYTLLLLGKNLKVEQANGLERTYYFSKSNKMLKTLKESKALTNDLAKLDHNKILDLYPDNEYIFGPYLDSNADEVSLVYLLFTNRINQSNEVTVLYAGRVLAEHDCGEVLEYKDEMKSIELYCQEMKQRETLKGKLSNNCYYRPYVWTEHERSEICRIYGAQSVSNPRYNSLRENFICGLMLGRNTHINVNVYRLLYEVHVAKRRLTDTEVVSPVNGKKADLRVENVYMRDLAQEEEQMRKEALELYGLDTYKLESIYAKTGFNRFRGIYQYSESQHQAGLTGRRYVKLVKDGTDLQHTILLSRALMTVHKNRILMDDETVDHIDHNSQNDKLENLRIVSRKVHSAEDSVRVEVDPIECGCCGKKFIPSDKAFWYFKSEPKAIPFCTPKCKESIQELSEEQKEALRSAKKITFRYYVIDKDRNVRKYLPEGLDYVQARKLVMEKGEDAFVRSV